MSNVRAMEFDPELDIQILDGVYEPAEDSHLLLEAIQVERGMRVLEVGTGSGFIALHCAKAGAVVTATDISPLAIQNAKDNTKKNGLDIDIVQTDLIQDIDGEFDLIIFNPPYLSDKDIDGMEPSMRNSISGGAIGSELSIRFLNEVKDLLAEDGMIYLLTSSESEEKVLDHAKNIYHIEKVNESKLFFEKLSVHQMKLI
ncbi:MAG: methyltransferase [Thermoplasmata archaeon]|nr:methyltransferase [Thermoplasmata archaeon]